MRNPFDNITTMHLRSGKPVLDVFRAYRKRCNAVMKVKRMLAPERVLDLRHEDLVDDPKRELRRVCAFLGVEPHSDYLDACASIVFRSPHRSRYKIEWTSRKKQQVLELIEQCEFLRGYGFED